MKEKMQQKYKDMPIRMKITVVFIICFVAFMGLMLVVPDIFLYRSRRLNRIYRKNAVWLICR